MAEVHYRKQVSCSLPQRTPGERPASHALEAPMEGRRFPAPGTAVPRGPGLGLRRVAEGQPEYRLDVALDAAAEGVEVVAPPEHRAQAVVRIERRDLQGHVGDPVVV